MCILGKVYWWGGDTETKTGTKGLHHKVLGGFFAGHAILSPIAMTSRHIFFTML